MHDVVDVESTTFHPTEKGWIGIGLSCGTKTLQEPTEQKGPNASRRKRTILEASSCPHSRGLYRELAPIAVQTRRGFAFHLRFVTGEAWACLQREKHPVLCAFDRRLDLISQWINTS